MSERPPPALEPSRKLGGASFSGIEDLEQGQRIAEGPIFELLDWIDSRLDCADFRLVTILRALYSYSALLSEGTLAAMRRSVLGFRYAMDEPGEDSMCFWSENHQLLFASCEYLAGALYPRELFDNAGLPGKAHREKGRRRLLAWLSRRWEYGFSEWHSNTYYEEDAAGLSLLVDFAPDEELRAKSTIVLDLLLLDLAAHSYRGFFAASSGRCYEEQKKDPFRADCRDLSEALFGFGNAGEPDWSKLGANLLLSMRRAAKGIGGYFVPPLVRAIGREEGKATVLCSMGLALGELDEAFPDKGDLEGRGLFSWGMEAFTNPETIELSMKMWRKWNLRNNGFLRELRLLDRPWAERLGLLPWAVRALNPVTRGLAIQRADTYTVRTADWMLSTAQRHHPGEFADQQHLWQAVFASGASLFVTHPAKAYFIDADRNSTPGPWVGCGVFPDAVQEGGVHLSIYDLRVRKGLLEGDRALYTHAWLPVERFDEVRLEGRYAFARTGGAYAALSTRNGLEKGEPGELIQRGAQVYWVCELASAAEWSSRGGFDGFSEAVRSRVVEFDGRRLVYRGEKVLDLTWKGPFLVDGRAVETDYPRFDSPWGRVERRPRRVELRCAGSSLLLDFEAGRREYS